MTRLTTTCPGPRARLKARPATLSAEDRMALAWLADRQAARRAAHPAPVLVVGSMREQVRKHREARAPRLATPRAAAPKSAASEPVLIVGSMRQQLARYRRLEKGGSR